MMHNAEETPLPAVFRRDTQIGVVYTTYKVLTVWNKDEPLKGFCRIHFINGNIVEGQFNNSPSSQDANYYTWHNSDWIRGNYSHDLLMHGNCREYNGKGDLLYEGQFSKCVREGLGIESYGENGTSIGTWKQGMREGLFTQTMNNYSVRCQGKYLNNQKVEKWHYATNNQSKYVQYSKVKEQTGKIRIIESREKIESLQKIKNSYLDNTHNKYLVDSTYQKIDSTYLMLDDSIISAWAKLLHCYVSGTKALDKVILTVDHLKLFGGISLLQKRYPLVEFFSRHLKGNFNILAQSGEPKGKTILIPIIKNCHFSLAVLKVIYQQYDIEIKCTIYDSLGYQRFVRHSTTGYSKTAHQNQQPSQERYQAIRDFLINEAKNDSGLSNRDEVLEILQQNKMTLDFQNCPSQSDGVSCGVFVCLFMCCICTDSPIPQRLDYQQVSWFRSKILGPMLKQPTLDSAVLKQGMSQFIKSCAIAEKVAISNHRSGSVFRSS